MKELKIKNKIISKDHPVFIIADIGINHEGDIEKAKRMIKDAAETGVDCIKFQMHILEDEMSKEAKTVVPGNANESIWEIMERCSLSIEQHQELKKYCEDLGVIYLCTPFSRSAANILREMNVEAYKIGSGECNNYPLIEHIASFGKPILLSTGMNNMDSVSKSVKIIKEADVPYAIFHCTSIYPTPFNRVNLGAMKELEEKFNVPVGLSDHSVSIHPSLGAVALGAAIIENHFTSDKNWPGPDISLSITPHELKELIIGSKAIFEARGGSKEILAEEQPTINFAYASVVTIADVKKGEVFTKKNIWVKRPGTGILAEKYWDILGKKATKDIKHDELLKEEDII